MSVPSIPIRKGHMLPRPEGVRPLLTNSCHPVNRAAVVLAAEAFPTAADPHPRQRLWSPLSVVLLLPRPVASFTASWQRHRDHLAALSTAVLQPRPRL